MGKHKNEVNVKAGLSAQRKEAEKAFPTYRTGLKHYLETIDREDVCALETSEEGKCFSFILFSRDGRQLPRYERMAVEAFTIGWWWGREFPVEVKATLT